MAQILYKSATEVSKKARLQWLKEKRIKLLNEFENLEQTGETIKSLAIKYGMKPSDISLILKGLKSSKKYEMILHALSENEKRWTFETVDNIFKVKSIFDSLGQVEQDVTLQQKIQFSYLFDKLKITSSLNDMYELLVSDYDFGEDMSEVKYFLSGNLGSISRHYSERVIISGVSQKGGWFLPYNHEDYFKIESGHPSTISYLNKNNEIVKIDADTGKAIVNVLEENDISTRICIVTEAFRKFAGGELETFISDLKSGDYFAKSNDKILIKEN